MLASMRWCSTVPGRWSCCTRTARWAGLTLSDRARRSRCRFGEPDGLAQTGPDAGEERSGRRPVPNPDLRACRQQARSRESAP